jgi:hypothetical protein
MRARIVASASLFSVLLSAKAAWPCGLTPPIGPTGLPALCHGDGVPTFRLGQSVGGTSTKIDYGGKTSELVQGAAVLSLDVNPLRFGVLEALTISGNVGASLGGYTDYDGTRYHLSPGVIAGVGASYRFLGQNGLPFIQPSFSYSVSLATSDAPGGGSASYTAKDWRAGVVIGRSFGGFAVPFVAARKFGAGTSWEIAGKGEDHFRYQLGAGSAFALTQHMDVFGEVDFLGEKRVTLGMGYTF